MKRKYSLIEWAMRHPSIVFLVAGLLVIFGIIALAVMPKQEFPGYTIRQGLIVGVYPGATSEEVEKQLAEPLEQFLFSYPEVRRNYTTTTSRNGVCYAMVELNEDVNNKDELWSKIKHGLNTLKLSLPKGVIALVARDDFGDVSAILLALSSDERSFSELKNYTDELSARLRRIESVSNIRLYGEQPEQITVSVDRDKLSSYGISDKILMAEFFVQSLAPGGKIKNDETEVPVHLAPVYSSVREVGDHILYSDGRGNMIRIKDIAEVQREYPRDNSYILNNGHPCLLISVEMREGFNIVRFGKDVDKILSEFRENFLPKNVSADLITNQADVVSGSVMIFLRELFVAIIVIIIVVILLFPIRSALTAAAVIPLNTFISVGIMYMFGIPLNTVTFAALVVVLGMTVDNSIVMIDGYLHLLNKGNDPREAAVESAHKYFMPMFLATACICLIFFPVLILFKGQFAEFTYFFPFTITINLMISLILAVMVVPIIEAAFIRPAPDNSTHERKPVTDKVHALYVRLLNWNFRHPWLTVMTGVLSIFASLLIVPHINFRMMPVAERDQFAVEISMPDGTTLTRTAQIADSLRILLSKDPRVRSIIQFTGTSSPRFHISYAPKIPSDSYAQFIVNTGSAEETEALLDEYTDLYAHYFMDAYIKFRQIDFQHVPSFEFRFSGDDKEELKNAAQVLMEEMREIPGLTNIHNDWGSMLPVMDVTLDAVAASQAGAARSLVSANIALATNGFPVGSLTENNRNIPIVLRTSEKKGKPSLEDLKSIYIPTFIPTVAVPLRQIATVAPIWSENNIIHRNGVRTITVTADLKRGIVPTKLLSSVQDIIRDEIVPSLPDEVQYKVGGEPEYNRDNLLPILYTIMTAFILIFFFLLFTYGKFGLTFISLFTLLLFLFGAVCGLWISGMTVGLTTVLGLIGLFGITVRNVILLFQHAEQRFVAEGWSAKDAGFDAGKRRMVPIFLTSAAVSVGVIPMIIEGSSFWAPVGIVIFSGGIFLLLMTITILPVLYWKLNDKRQ